MSRTIAFLTGLVVTTVVGWIVTSTTFPAFAFMFGAWGSFLLYAPRKSEDK